jgi:hypothetical protein
MHVKVVKSLMEWSHVRSKFKGRTTFTLRSQIGEHQWCRSGSKTLEMEEDGLTLGNEGYPLLRPRNRHSDKNLPANDLVLFCACSVHRN